MNPGELEQSHFAQWEVECAITDMESDPTVEWETLPEPKHNWSMIGATLLLWLMILTFLGLFWSGVGYVIYRLVTR